MDSKALKHNASSCRCLRSSGVLRNRTDAELVFAFRHNVSRYDLRFAMRTRQGWLQHEGFPATSPICSKSS